MRVHGLFATVSFWLFMVWVIALTLAIWAARIAQRFGVRLPRYMGRPIETEAWPRVAVILPIALRPGQSSEHAIASTYCA